MSDPPSFDVALWSVSSEDDQGELNALMMMASGRRDDAVRITRLEGYPPVRANPYRGALIAMTLDLAMVYADLLDAPAIEVEEAIEPTARQYLQRGFAIESEPGKGYFNLRRELQR